MAANGNSTKNTEADKASESTEAAAEEQVQILFKVSETTRDELKVVALLEKAGGLQGLFARVASELVTKHRSKLDELFSETAA